MNKKNESVQEVVRSIGNYLRNEKPWLFDLDKAVETFGNGVMQVDLRIYRGFVTDLIIHKSKRITYRRG